MVGAGFLMFFIAAFALFLIMRKQEISKIKVFRFLPLAIVLPYLANSSGWILTEMGRQPWVVYGYLKTADAVSPSVTAGMVWMSIIGFTLVYGILMVADIYLLSKFARSNPIQVISDHADENTKLLGIGKV